MKQIFSKFKTVLLFSGLLLFIGSSFIACSNDKKASEENSTTDSITAQQATTDSLPAVDSTAVQKPEPGNNKPNTP